MTTIPRREDRHDASVSDPHAIDVLVGRNLRSARRRRGLTQRELGAGVGLTLQQIQKYENGSNRINVSRLHRFSQILGLPVSHFFATSEDEAAPSPGPLAAPSGEDAELIELLSKVTPRMKRRLICLMEEMTDRAG